MALQVTVYIRLVMITTTKKTKPLAARGFQPIHGLDQFQNGELDRIIPRESTAEYQRNPMPRLTVFGPDRLHGQVTTTAR